MFLSKLEFEFEWVLCYHGYATSKINEVGIMALRKETLMLKKRVLACCVRLFLKQGYHQTTLAQIYKETNISASSFQHLFQTKDGVLFELTKVMFNSQFKMAKSMAKNKLPPIYVYATETAIQLSITELNENIREIYVEAYRFPKTAELIFKKMALELSNMMQERFQEYTEQDFYEIEIGTSGLMVNYMAKKCDEAFPLEKKIERFLVSSMRIYKISEEEQAEVLAYIQALDIRKLAEEVIKKLFVMLEMEFDFKF